MSSNTLCIFPEITHFPMINMPVHIYPFCRPWDRSPEILSLWVQTKRLQASDNYLATPIPTTGEAFVVLFDRWYRERANRFATRQPCPSGADISALYTDLSNSNPRLYSGPDMNVSRSPFKSSPSRRTYSPRSDFRSDSKSGSMRRNPRPYPDSSWARLVKLCTQHSVCATWNGDMRECTRKKSADGKGCTTPKGDLAHLCPRCKKDHKFVVNHHNKM